MYYLLFIIALFFLLREVITKKISEISFYVIYFLMTMMVIFRYGQGSDYFNYESIYYEVKYLLSISFYAIFYRGDPGYVILNYLSIKAGFSYTFFVALFSFTIMVLFYRFYKNVCKKSMIPLFVFYATFFLVYPFSAVRQGFGLAITLGVLYPLLIKGKYFKYVIITFLASLVHLSVLIVLLIPIIYKIRIKKNTLLLLFSAFFVIMILDIDLFSIIPSFSRIDAYSNVESTSLKYFAKIARTIALLPVFFIPQRIYNENSELRGLANILFAGFVLYSITSSNELIASRLNIYYKIFEGLFFYQIIYSGLKVISKQLLYCYLLFWSIFFLKDINGFIAQGRYENCNILTYPYISIFDSDETLFYYRKNVTTFDQ